MTVPEALTPRAKHALQAYAAAREAGANRVDASVKAADAGMLSSTYVLGHLIDSPAAKKYLAELAQQEAAA